MSNQRKSQITFNLKLDENEIPEQIEWKTSDDNESGKCESVLMALWDAEEGNTLRIDLWTKNMLLDDMKMFFYQSFMTMADSLERATSDEDTAQDIREFANKMGKKMEIIKEAED